MSTTRSYAEDITIEPVRTDDEWGSIVVTITTDNDTITIGCGRFYDDAVTLRDSLASALSQAESIVKDWQDLPDADGDGFVFEDRGRYYVQLEGSTWQDGHFPARNDRSNWRPQGYPSRDIAEYELARAMIDAGCFPNAWYQNERGYQEDIGESVRSSSATNRPGSPTWSPIRTGARPTGDVSPTGKPEHYAVSPESVPSTASTTTTRATRGDALYASTPNR